jgi:hypothetical protein
MLTDDPEHGPIRDDIDSAYDDAERWWEEGARRVAVHLSSSTYEGGALRWGVADTRERERYDAEWVVGRERWRASERTAIAEGRA